jgi:hypothetical protein
MLGIDPIHFGVMTIVNMAIGRRRSAWRCSWPPAFRRFLSAK